MVAAADVQHLWEQFKATKDQDLRRVLVLRYAPLVKYVVGRMAISLPGLLDSEDIISHATIGLMDAIERFDPGRGLKFETYAIPRIRGSIIDAVRRLGAYPRGTRRKMREIDTAIAFLEDSKGRKPTDEEVAEYLGISVDDYNRDLQEASFAIVPLDGASRITGDDEFLALSEIIEDEQSPNPAGEAERAELRAILIDAINELPERDRILIALYYDEEMTLKEISQVLEISESRVCQLHARAILRLRKALSRAGLLTGVA